ncbi:hypothetical protein ACFHW2_41770 [Actinomadura sp. LOL_016]|uniref:hypothetical protein n=1 Tax=unclassified Actinomadura TaxID=2626254 RepID=UPI003A8020C8
MRHKKLEEILLLLRDDLLDGPVPVVTRPLGYLMPESTFRTWDFVDGGDLGEVANSLAEAVSTYGEPFIATYSDWGTLSRDLEKSDLLLEHEKAMTLPVVAAMNAETGRATKMVELELDGLRGRDDAYAEAYRNFAVKFFEMPF